MKKPPHHLFVITAMLMLSLRCIAWNGDPSNQNDSTIKLKAHQWMRNEQGLRFLENKGQMEDMQGKPASNLLFKASATGTSIYITTSGISYVFTRVQKQDDNEDIPDTEQHNLHDDEDDKDSLLFCRADMELVGADIRKENVVKEYESKDYNNYYLGDVCPNGIMNVYSYQKITIKNIYPGIDWILYTDTKNLKYDFIVHPGADPSLIKLNYKWTDKPKLQNDGSVKITTPFGDIVEGKPISYTQDIYRSDSIITKYIIKDNRLSFNIGKYDKSKILVIDPALVWATYYGGLGTVEDVCALKDDGTNVWMTGWTEASNFPTLNPGGGAYFQGAIGGPYNIFILKFNLAGVCEWATYYGGNGEDEAYSISTDGNYVWLTGLASSTNFPTLNPGGSAYFQGTVTVNAVNAFVLQLTPAGVRKWATFYGGSKNDQANSIYSDGTNVWLTGRTQSPNFPTLNPGGGAYFQGTLAGVQNAFITQFSIAGALKWSTYYGGNGDVGNSLCGNGSSVWILGNTATKTFPTVNPGGGTYFQSTLGGTQNLFISQFNTSGVCQWATFYGGNGSDNGACINYDGTYLWATGWTTSKNFPEYNPGGSAYFQANRASFSPFILKFSSSGVCDWATFYSGTFEDYAYSIQSDTTNVWVTGYTNSTDLPLLNPGTGFYSAAFNGGNQTFILEFNATTDACKWATLYGTDMENDGCYISSDGTNVFLGGDAYACCITAYPTVNPGGGAYYETTESGGEACYIGKFTIYPCYLTSSKITDTKSVICTGDSTTLFATPVGSTTVKYSWLPGGQTTPTIHITPTATTKYIVTVKDTIGRCSYKDSVTITVNTTPTVVASALPASVCAGASTTLTASGSGTYLWSTGATASSVSVSPTSSTTYTVIGTSSGCKDTTKVAVNVVPLPTVTLSGIKTICLGNSTTLTANGGTSYLWSNGATTSSINPTPAKTTTYTVGINDGTCTKDTSIVVTVNPLPNAKISGQNQLCYGDSTTLTASGGTSYAWNTGQTSSGIRISPALTTTYSVTVSNGVCIKDTSVVLTVNTLPNATISGANSICAGSSTVLTASGGTSYTWNTGLTTSSINVSPSSANTYSVSVSNGICAKDTTISITINPLPNAKINGQNQMCFGDSTTLTASGGISYAWSNGSTTSVITVKPVATTTYTIAVNNGTCVKDTGIKVTVNALPVASISGSNSICIGDSTLLIASGGTSYAWNTGATTSGIEVKPVSSTTYSVTVSKGLCLKDTSIGITVNNVPVVTITGTQSICTGANTLLTASGGTNYKWSTGATTSKLNIAPVVTTTYSVIVGNGLCVKDTSTVVIVNALPNITVTGINSICMGDSATLTASGGTNYSWNTGATTSSIVVIPLTTTTYTVNGSNGTCSKDTSITITVNSLPTVTISGANSICAGNSTTLTASGGTSYVWSTGATTSSINEAPLITTTYTVNITNGKCKKDTSKIITVNPLPVVTINGVNLICAGDTTLLTASGGTNYIWNTGATSSSINVIVSANSAYSVSISNGTCTKDTSIAITVIPKPVVMASLAQTLCSGNSIVITASGANTYTWNPSAGLSSTNVANPIASPTVTTTYIVAGAIGRCIGEDSVTINVKSCDSIFVPNVFTPNGDNKNDVLLVTVGNIKTYHIEIFSRWGDKVFESTDPNNSWNGRSLSNIMQSDGVYYYLITGDYNSGKPYRKEGFIQLIR